MNIEWQARRTVLLQEATELSQLFQSIEGAFAAGELQKIADMLATMRRSLKLVGNVPEFSGGKERLQARGTSAILKSLGETNTSAVPNSPDNTNTVPKAHSSHCQSCICVFWRHQSARLIYQCSGAVHLGLQCKLHASP